MRSFLLVLLLVAYVAGDMYMHNPRGSNNRLSGRGTNRANNNRMCNTQNNAKGGYAYGPHMYYYVGSVLQIEWTNQHGCGHDNLDCNVVIQYMCGDEVRDGVTTNSIPNDESTYNQKEDNPDIGIYRSNTPEDLELNQVYTYGMHESYEYYKNCSERSRNKGLFTADQNPGPSARSTRQNPGGGRSAFECQEERDYYPYWHPSPWRDIAVLTDDVSRCPMYQSESQNVQRKNYCSVSAFNNEAECIQGKGTWKESDTNGGGEPHCTRSRYSRDNHLGNGLNGKANQYRWTIPDTPHEFCVLRLRYNISSTDYNGWNTYADQNKAKSPIKNDPYVYYGTHDNGMTQNLSLAINTNQFGRTFQDRSHTFEIRSRPSSVLPLDRIYNLNVKGKRGNIVQTFPAVEYDFHPTELEVSDNDYVHFQWTGSDFNPNGNDGEGVRGTDRSNLVVFGDRGKNLIDFEDDGMLNSDEKQLFAHLNQQNCSSYEELYEKHNGNKDNIERDPDNCMKLNAASPYFDGGLKKVSAGTYSYVSTRNNNFTNRSQKGGLSVRDFLPVWATVLVVLSAVACCIAIPVSVVGFVARLLPDSKFAQGWRLISQIKRTDAMDDAVDAAAADGVDD